MGITPDRLQGRHDAAGGFPGCIMAKWNSGGKRLTAIQLYARLTIYAILEFLAALKKRQLFGLDLHLLAGLGVPAGVALVMLDEKCAEPADFCAVPSFKRPADGIEKNLHHSAGFRFGKMGVAP